MEKKLPKNWVETELGEILKLKNGYAFKTKDYREEGIPLIRIGNIQQGNVSTEKSIYVDKNDSAEGFIVEKGDVLVAMSGATTGKYGVFNEDIKAYQNQRVGNLKPFAPHLTSKQFIYYLLGGLRKEIEEKAYGGAQPNISPKLIETIKIGFPPLAEQQRIVAKLDALFEHLDTLKTRLNNIPQILKNFRQAVLTQAVTGKLTEEWRVGKELEELKYKKLEDFSECRLGKMLDKSKNKGVLVDYLRNKNVRWFKIDFDDVYQMKVEDSDLLKLKLVYGDVLVCEGGEPGRAAIWKNERENIVFQKALHRVRLNNFVLPDYFLYNLKVDADKETLNKLFTGTTIKHLTGRAFAKYEILVPSVEEQTEIVKRVEVLFAKADKIEAQYQTLKTKIDSLPQAILAKAFKGELVEQLDTDGSAEVLLEEIQKLKAEAAREGKKLKKKTIKNKK